jgi:hypothetical protein
MTPTRFVPAKTDEQLDLQALHRIPPAECLGEQLPRLEMRPRMVRSPVDICLGTRPIQAEKSRPLANAAPLPIAAIIALEMIGINSGVIQERLQEPRARAKFSGSSDGRE